MYIKYCVDVVLVVATILPFEAVTPVLVGRKHTHAVERLCRLEGGWIVCLDRFYVSTLCTEKPRYLLRRHLGMLARGESDAHLQ